MEISELDTASIHDKGAEMRVKDQYGKELDCYITFCGLDSKQWREIQSDRERNIMLAAIGEDVKNDDRQAMAKAVISWRGFTKEGKELEYSFDEAVNLFKIAPYILDQSDAFIGNRRNFTKG